MHNLEIQGYMLDERERADVVVEHREVLVGLHDPADNNRGWCEVQGTNN